MKLTNTSEYSLRILTFMAKEPERLYPARYLIEKLNISDKYLRRIMTNLSKAGFIYSIQGREGGYLFARKPEEITLAEVVDAVEGMKQYTGCVLGFCECSDENPCVMHNTWVEIREDFVRTFDQTTLGKLEYGKINKY